MIRAPYLIENGSVWYDCRIRREVCTLRDAEVGIALLCSAPKDEHPLHECEERFPGRSEWGNYSKSA